MRILFLFILLLLQGPNLFAGNKQPADYVNPFICTQGDHGQWLPSAKVPFGMVEPCPDTYPGSLTADGDFAHGGYDYSDSRLRGFSNFHKGSSGGTRVVDRAGLLSFIPLQTIPSDTFLNNPVLEFDKASETAKPGYYSVRLVEENILAELSSTLHTTYHRYTFPKGKTAKLFMFEGNRERARSLSCSIIDNQTISGKLDVYNGIYFVIKFNSTITFANTWDGKKLLAGSVLKEQHKGGILFEFENLNGSPLEIRMGFSLTGEESAIANLNAENPGFNFSDIKQKAYDLWNNILKGIDVEGDEEYKTIFYTALYHACFLPVNLTDVNGNYPGLDKKIHKAVGYKHYNNYAFWDSFRTKYPLYSLFVPDVYKDIALSLNDLYRQGDWDKPDASHKPHGPNTGFEMTGKDGFEVFDNCRNEHMLMVAADAYFKGISGTDINELYTFLEKEAFLQMNKSYDKYGYIPERPDQTGEFCWDSWCVAQAAKAAGKQTEYEYFMKRANYWRNTWDPSIKYFRARAADGSWLDFPADPAENREKYTYEGSKWHWRWNILHDVPALIEMFGNKEKFTEELAYFFDNDLYTAGNQPDIHAPYLFNYAGAAWLTQKWTHKLLTEPVVQKYGTHRFFDEPKFGRIFKAAPDGYIEEMDDDYGCMSSWYALSAMGLYQVCPGDPVYQLTSPVFNEITINPGSKLFKGMKFKIIANNYSKDNYYIQSATLNGKPLKRCWITYDEIKNGGELVYNMGPEPNKDWGKE